MVERKKIYGMRFQCVEHSGDWCIVDNEDGVVLIRGKWGLSNMKKQIERLEKKLASKSNLQTKEKNPCSRCGHSKDSHVGGFIKGTAKNCCIRNWGSKDHCECSGFKTKEDSPNTY